MKITKKQICLLFFTIITSSKFLILPTVYSYLANQDTWFAGLLNCTADLFLLLITLKFINKFEEQTLYEVVEVNLGKFWAKAVFLVYAVYFLLKSTLPIFEQKMFIEITLYETAPSVFTFLPFFIISFYVCLKGVKAMARTGEIIFWLTAIGFGLVIFLSIGTTNFYYLKPILKNPINRTLFASYNGFIWYGQPLILLFLAGKIKKEKRFNLSVILSFCVSAAVCVFLYAVFTGIYGDLSVRQIYSLTKMTKYAIALSNVGRFDYVATLLLTMGSILSLSVPLVFAVECLSLVFGNKRKWLIALIANGAMLIFVAIFHMRFQTILDLFEKIFTPIMIFLVYVLPPFFLLFRRKQTNDTLF